MDEESIHFVRTAVIQSIAISFLVECPLCELGAKFVGVHPRSTKGRKRRSPPKTEDLKKAQSSNLDYHKRKSAYRHSPPKTAIRFVPVNFTPRTRKRTIGFPCRGASIDCNLPDSFQSLELGNPVVLMKRVSNGAP